MVVDRRWKYDLEQLAKQKEVDERGKDGGGVGVVFYKWIYF